jgi:hypothetical protein
MDNIYNLDYDEILKTVRKADVLIFRFVTVPQRLLVDNRANDVDGPLVKIVPRAESTEDRFKSLKMLRPRFKLPCKISAVWWPRYVRALEDQGIWSEVVKRIVDQGYPAAAAECNDVFRELVQMERDELANAIGGEGYRTLWPAGRQR